MFDFLSKRFGAILDRFGNRKTLTPDNIKETLSTITDALLEADVPYELAQTFVADVKQEVMGQKITKSLKPGQQFVKIIHDRLKAFLGADQTLFSIPTRATYLVMGLQGSGKTTSIAKLAHYIKEQDKSKRILLASVDFYRPAAVDQLEQLALKAGLSFYRSEQTDPIKAAQNILDYYRNERFDILFLDTSGRMHIDNQMLQELRNIKQVVEPTHSFIVLDAMTGQESLNVAKAFDQSVGFDAALLSKMDSDTRGGAAFSFRFALKKPIQFVGVGEKLDDLEPFKADRMAGRILDMGDIVTLAEKAEKKIEQEEQESLMKAMMSGRFTLDDFAKQLKMMSKLGSMGSLMKYMPGMGNMQISSEQMEQGEYELKKFKALMGSMTKKERLTPKILNASRKKRIAKGAGMAVTDINLLLSRFEQSQQYVKLLSKMSRGKRFF